MRGRNTNFEYLGVEILKILEESNSPMSALGINFAINSKLDRIVELNIVKNHLKTLMKNRKIAFTVKDKTPFFLLRE